MEKLNLYKIRDMAMSSKRAVYSVQQLANLIKKPKAISKVYFSRLVNRSLAKRILRGKISFIDDDYIIASQLIEPSYISLTSALLFHNLIQQVPRMVECVTPINSRKYPELGIIYHKIPSALFYGYEKYQKNGSYMFIANPEKAVIDGIYLNLFPVNLLDDILDKLDKKRLRKYVSRFKGRGKKKLEEMLYDR